MMQSKGECLNGTHLLLKQIGMITDSSQEESATKQPIIPMKRCAKGFYTYWLVTRTELESEAYGSCMKTLYSYM